MARAKKTIKAMKQSTGVAAQAKTATTTPNATRRDRAALQTTQAPEPTSVSSPTRMAGSK